MSYRTPLELGLSAFLGRFYASLQADTQAMTEYVARGLSKSIVFVPGRMIDDVQHMIAEWRKNQNNPGPGLSSMLPVIFVAIDKNFQVVLPDWSVATPKVDFSFPDDELQRAYKVSTSTIEYRVQLAIAAPEAATAHSLILQFNAFTQNGLAGRRFYCTHEFAGFKSDWRAILEAIDYGGVSQGLDQTNLTILTIDMNVRMTVPLFIAPGANEPNDGKAAPSGYAVVLDVTTLDTLSGALGEKPKPGLSGASSHSYLDADGNPVTDVTP